MTEAKVAPYGSWKSPISAELVVSSAVGLSSPIVDGEDIYWLEGRPANQGRVTLVRLEADGRSSDVTAPDFNVRTRVHEYGGGAYIVKGGVAYCSNFDDNR